MSSNTGSDYEDLECPLCLEELDLSDRKFKPCPCGYQICRFCWHHIREQSNGTCPACRRPYSDQPAEFEAVDPAEVARLQKEKKQKDREKREMENANRRHLANMRVVQKNLVYVVGLPSKLAHEETLKQHEYFGQYGRISKVIISKKPDANTNETGVYITFQRKEDAARCIQAVEGTVYEGRILKASFGTTKYCTFYLRGLNCQNPTCMYLHEPGEDADSFTREEIATGKHQTSSENGKQAANSIIASAAPTHHSAQHQNLLNSSHLQYHPHHQQGHVHGSSTPPGQALQGFSTSMMPQHIRKEENGLRTPWKTITSAAATPPSVGLSSEDWPATSGLNSSALPASAAWAKPRTSSNAGVEEMTGALASSGNSSQRFPMANANTNDDEMPNLIRDLAAAGIGVGATRMLLSRRTKSNSIGGAGSSNSSGASVQPGFLGALFGGAGLSHSAKRKEYAFSVADLYQKLPLFSDIFPCENPRAESAKAHTSALYIAPERRDSVNVARGFAFPLAVLSSFTSKTELPYNCSPLALFADLHRSNPETDHMDKSLNRNESIQNDDDEIVPLTRTNNNGGAGGGGAGPIASPIGSSGYLTPSTSASSLHKISSTNAQSSIFTSGLGIKN